MPRLAGPIAGTVNWSPSPSSLASVITGDSLHLVSLHARVILPRGISDQRLYLHGLLPCTENLISFYKTTTHVLFVMKWQLGLRPWLLSLEELRGTEDLV